MISPVVIPTERSGVILRELTEADDQIYHEAYEYSRPEIAAFDGAAMSRYLTVEAVAEAREKAKASGKLRLGILDGDAFVGMIGRTPYGSRAEIGYWIDSRHTGKRYATLATRAVVAYDVNNFDTLFAHVVEGNDASVRVLENSGFREFSRRSGQIILHYMKEHSS